MSLTTRKSHPLWCAITALAAVVVLTLPAHAAPPLPGAIFTTTVDGSVVNENVHYNSKCEVYLDGGPGPNAPQGAAGLPAGDYYFQVTDPSGKKLLSTDAVSNRRFTVAGGIITAYTGVGGPPHPTGVDVDHGAVTIQLANNTCPTDFLDTPNNGGVYKAWVTPVGDFVGDPSKVDNACGNGCFHGFLPAASKTDNFKVKGAKTATFCLTLEKLVADSKGSTSLVAGWGVTITGDSFNNRFFTSGLKDTCSVLLTAGTYTVTEDLTFEGVTYTVIGLKVNGVDLPPSEVYSFNWSPGKPDPFIIIWTNQVGK
jgi:hypothetical protein